ncbi:hypothetical protein Avbf_07975 [Armadillidium vulgare]|nr:hypothetical protein Avbf_07975 [Armadillidium vulgare]
MSPKNIITMRNHLHKWTESNKASPHQTRAGDLALFFSPCSSPGGGAGALKYWTFGPLSWTQHVKKPSSS